ncbi:MAG: hypothetical protein AAF821_04535 [Cyanobacteria bacterium P01_D01_bin.156]
MATHRTQPVTVTNPSGGHPWRKTISGVALLTFGFQGTAANAVNVPDTLTTNDVIDETVEKTGVESTLTGHVVLEKLKQPRFSPLRWQSSRSQTAVNLSLERLKQHRRELHSHSNDVEFQLLGLQQLLSLEPYSNSFADELLKENTLYQNKLEEVKTLEIDIHRALEQDNGADLNRLQLRLRNLDEELRTLAQQQLKQYVEQAQNVSSSGIWQEPMYHASLEWLMDYTHERHLLKARHKTLAQTMVAMAAE